jgi:hypothetical protein
MSNLFMIPFVEPSPSEKTASGGPDEYAQVLVSGDPESIASIMSDEDLAFHKLGEDLMEKLAGGSPLTEQDVDVLDDTEVAALSLLSDGNEPGPEIMYKVAAYLEFYNELAANERAGRNFARAYVQQQKLASVRQEEDVQKLANHPGFQMAMATKAQQILHHRGVK